MRKTILALSSLFLLGTALQAQTLSGNPDIVPSGTTTTANTHSGGGILLTQSVDPLSVTDGGVACWNNGNGEYRDNRFFRAYKLSDFGVTLDFQIEELQWGQGSADANNVLTLNVYTADTDDLATASLTLIGTETHMSDPGDDLKLVSKPFSATIPAGSIVVFEIFSPDGGLATDVRYFPGINASGENDDSYLMSEGCSITVPTTTTDIGFSDNQYVMNILGTEVLGVNDNLAELISLYPSPATTELTLRSPASIQIDAVTVFDVLGKQVPVLLNGEKINVSNLQSGVYLIQIDTNKGVLTQKFVKE